MTVDLGLRVTGAGMCNAVGLYPLAVEAAVNAGVSRVIEGSFLDIRGEPAMLARVPEQALPPLDETVASQPKLSPRTRRMLRLAGPALAQALAGVPPSAPPILLLAAPSSHVLPSNFITLLARQAKQPIDLTTSKVELGGRATSLALLGRAAELLDAYPQRPVVVGGVDSHIDLRTLANISLDERLHTPLESDGFAPGEGAAFVHLGRAWPRGARVSCTISGLGLDREPGVRGSEAPYLGDGLARAFAQALDGQPAPASTIYTSFNGERYWGRELGIAVLRNRKALEEDFALEHPVQWFGDLGAATGASLLALGVTALQRRRMQGPIVAYASSDDGARAVVAVRKEER